MLIKLAAAGFAALALLAGYVPAQAADAAKYPIFEVDRNWPKLLPDKMLLADIGGNTVDDKDNVWIVTRPRTLDKSHMIGSTDNTADCCMRAPAVVELDPDGNFIKGWGGPYMPKLEGGDYEWPTSEHGITIDYKGNVWICGNGGPDAQCLKFTQDGKFLLQIGHSGKSKGSLDTENLNHAAQAKVWPKTNEVFIADGYVNRRIIVFDADTGKFKRMWGAYGNKPDDSAPRPDPAKRMTDPAPQQFSLVHGVALSNDGFVYVNDRENSRIQVFTIEGKYVKEAFFSRETKDPFGTSFSIAFSPDKEQKYIFMSDGSNFKVHVIDRQTLLEIMPAVIGGRGGPYPGQFHWLHGLAMDSKGNLYTSESMGARIQKFTYKGMSQ